MTNYYIDKSLLIKDLFDNSSTVLVTAPRRFGKTVNIDMIRRFLEIEVDDDGNEIVNKTQTINYKLFTNLKIYKDHRELFDRHFGNHPVIYIDYSPLGLINSFDDLLETLMTIIYETYQKHNYLLDTKGLWGSDLNKESFRDHLFGTRQTKFLIQEDVMKAFVDLSRALYKRFKRPVFVLMDEYDAYFDNMIFQFSANIAKCINLIRTINSDLIETRGSHVGKIFMTGVLRVTGGGVFLPENVVDDYSFLYNHKFRRFYGLTGGELKNLLAIHTNNNETAVNELTRKIITRYRGYRILGKKYDVYNMRAVMKYLATGDDTSDSDLKNFINFFYFSHFRYEIVKLLQTGSLDIYVYDTLSKDDVVALRKFHDYSMTALPANVLDLSLYLLLELGFLTIKSRVTKHIVTVHIPNLELETEYAGLLRQSSINQFNLNADGITGLNNIMDLVSVDKNSDAMFGRIYENFQHTFFRTSYGSDIDKNFQCILYAIFSWKFRRVYASAFDVTRNASTDILWLQNDNNVSFIMQAKVTRDKKTRPLEECAHNVIDGIIRNGFIHIVQSNKVVYLGLCYSIMNNEIRLRYSKLLNEGDSLNKTTLAVLPYGLDEK